MLVIQGTIGGIDGVWPADRCHWTFSAATGGGYELDSAVFYPGANTAVGTSAASGNHTITNPVLGQIGKSGRFVAITN